MEKEQLTKQMTEGLLDTIIWLNENKFKYLNLNNDDQMRDLVREFRCLYLTAKGIRQDKEI